MKRYKEEVDALHASDTLKAAIAALPNEMQPKKRTRIRRVALIAAVLVVVLAAGVVSTPLLFSMQKSAPQDSISGSADYAADMEIMDETYDSLNDSKSTASQGIASYGYPTAPAPAAESTAAKAPVSTPALPSGRKIIRNAELTVETKTFDAFCTAVQQKTAALNGYVESSDTGSFSGETHYATLVLRIPAESLDAFLQHVSELGTITSQSTSVQDVTERYIDVKSRLAALETEQETLLGLLKKAENLTDTLEIQDRLTDVRGSLESYKAQLQSLDSQIDYSTVTMNVYEVERITPQESKAFFAQVRQNLSENLYSIGQGARGFAIWFLSSLPYIVIWLIVIGAAVAVVLLVRRRRRRRMR